MPEKIETNVAVFLVGVSLGSLLGILFAPKSGEETRSYLAEKTKQGSEAAQRKVRQIQERAEGFIERGHHAVAKRQEQIAQAINAGRQAYRREMSRG